MATQYERALIQHACIPESLRILVEEEIPDEMFPTEELQKVWKFAVDYWHQEGASGDIAPSPEAMRLHFDNILSEHDIDLDIEPTDTLTWAVETCRSAWIDRKWQGWTRTFAGGMASADLTDKKDVLDAAIDEMMTMQRQVSRRGEGVDVRHAFERQMEVYAERAALRQSGRVEGAIMGLPAVDAHMLATRPGEATVLAAGPKTGKSFLLLWAAYQHWLAGGTPTLVTLENSVEMTLDRLACMALALDSRALQRGELSVEEMETIRNWQESFQAFDRPFHIIQPEPGRRSLEQLLRRSRMYGDAMYLDQLTFLEFPGMERRPRHEQIGAALHEGKATISSGFVKHSLVMAHQINREGVKAAQRSGRLEMYHLAEAAEIERTMDWVLGLWQSRGLREVGRAWLQSLAARRADLVHWELIWRPFIGQIQVHGTIEMPDDDE